MDAVPLVAGLLFLSATGCTKGHLLTLLLALNACLWTAYGVSIGSAQIVVANAICLGSMGIRTAASVKAGARIIPAEA